MSGSSAMPKKTETPRITSSFSPKSHCAARSISMPTGVHAGEVPSAACTSSVARSGTVTSVKRSTMPTRIKAHRRIVSVCLLIDAGGKCFRICKPSTFSVLVFPGETNASFSTFHVLHFGVNQPEAISLQFFQCFWRCVAYLHIQERKIARNKYQRRDA